MDGFHETATNYTHASTSTTSSTGNFKAVIQQIRDQSTVMADWPLRENRVLWQHLRRHDPAISPVRVPGMGHV